jgi:hypothetical protein
MNGTIVLPYLDLRPGTASEVRFEVANGAWSEWQEVVLDLTERTDPDFNGPGCPCTWYTATARAIVVPVDARLPRN